MNIIIIGAGKVGYTLAKYLENERDNVTIIDNNTEALNHITDHLDVMGIKGNGTSLKILHEAGVKKADVVISVTNSDEVNMLCSLAAKKLGVNYTVARIRTPEYSEELAMLKDELGIDLIINPEKEAAIEIAKLIKFPSVCSVDTFSNGTVDLVSFRISTEDQINGKAICDISLTKGDVLFCGVERNGQINIPSGDFILKNDDKVYVIGEHNKIEVFFSKLGKYQRKVKTTLIVGGGRITYYLVKKIEEIGVSCKIIEQDTEKCKELNELLPNAIIINGDGTDHELLLSESLEKTDTFISLTGRDEENLITSLFASNNNVKNVITKITRFNYNQIAKNIGIDTVISPKTITANKILKYLRFLKNEKRCCIENIYKIFDERAEAIEFIVGKNARCLGEKIKDLTFKDDLIIATIVRGNKTIIPTGNDEIRLEDKVIVITKNNKLIDINDILLGGGK